MTPTPEEQIHIAALVSQIQLVLETMALDPATCLVDDFRLVGSYKKGTMIRGKNEADMVIIMRSVPTLEAVTKLSETLSEELSKTSPESLFSVTVTDYGFSVSNAATSTSVRMLMTTQIGNMRKSDSRPHVAMNLQQKHLSSIRHVRWFEG